MVAKWLAEARTRYRPSSYRQYRAALLWAADQTPGLAPAEREEMEALVQSANGADGQKRNPSLPLRTSAGKLKRFDEGDFERLRQLLQASPTPSDANLLAFLEANALVGLRPCEWANAHLSTDELGQAVLRVANGKHTNGRANGPVRTLTFSVQDSAAAMELLTPCLELVARVIAGAGPEAGPSDRHRVWSLHCRSLQDRFRMVNRRLWPRRKRHYSLYSTRHTLLAAAKTRFSPQEVAALAGHAVDATATEHYARPRRGGRGQAPKILPTPAEAEVMTVKKTFRAEGWRKAIEARERAGPGPR